MGAMEAREGCRTHLHLHDYHDATERVDAPIHNRMPAIVAKRNYSRWLESRIPGDEVADALTPYPAEEMDAYAITPAVNNPKTDGPELIRAADELRHFQKKEQP